MHRRVCFKNAVDLTKHRHGKVESKSRNPKGGEEDTQRNTDEGKGLLSVLHMTRAPFSHPRSSRLWGDLPSSFSRVFNR